jgi:hypothetical protein
VWKKRNLERQYGRTMKKEKRDLLWKSNRRKRQCINEKRGSAAPKIKVKTKLEFHEKRE